ncbi:MAG TPA: YMGG-like glycine zipper-containing protein, partial [Pyrinomonadaceae bacterium]|nr:YMGG-like glycine zipper-containing protein [Pyrinomonadaceae bacterium]
NDRQIDNIIRRIENRTDLFRRSMDNALDRSRYDGTRAENDINRFVSEFEQATDTLRSRFDGRTSVASDVENVLNRAAAIDDFMTRNRLNTRAQNDWNALRTDLDALAQAYGVTWAWGGRTFPTTQTGALPYRLGDREVGNIIRRIEQNTDRFRASAEAGLDRSAINNTRREDNLNRFIQEFEQATDQLRSRFDARTSVDADVENVLNRAAFIERFMTRNQLPARAENDWRLLRSDLDALASAYAVAWNWDTRPVRNGRDDNFGRGTFGRADLTGTFQLDRSRSEDARTAVERAVSTLPTLERQRVADRVLARLEAPEMLAIERTGTNVTIASSRAPQTTFTADNVERTEQLANGRTSRVRAGLAGDTLTVSSTGFRDNDFTVTFEPYDNGRSLRVTRRIFSDRLNQPVVVQNIYNRTSDVAQFGSVYTGTGAYAGGTTTYPTATGDFVIRDGEILVATLNNDLRTDTAQDGDRFTLTVRSPMQYEGATIEGVVRGVERGGRVSGRAGVTLDFDTIRMRDGRSYRFAGFVTEARVNGETVRVDNEGSVESGSRTNQTAQRAAIGTAVGAIIGAIAGGGKGAAIGAIVGAGAGAGSVYVQGKEDLNLVTGSELTIRASAPGNFNNNFR